MKAHGNGAAAVCANNLLRMVRGEVPFERVKGLDPAIFDQPIISARTDIEMSAEWLIENYEPRVTFIGVNVKESAETGGDLLIEAIVAEKEG